MTYTIQLNGVRQHMCDIGPFNIVGDVLTLGKDNKISTSKVRGHIVEDRYGNKYYVTSAVYGKIGMNGDLVGAIIKKDGSGFITSGRRPVINLAEARTIPQIIDVRK